MLLLNPCEDDPVLHLDFHEDGTVLPRPGSRVGAESNRPYSAMARQLIEEQAPDLDGR